MLAEVVATPIDPRRMIKDAIKAHHARRVQRVLGGRNLSLISSNCVGSRVSLMAGEPYASPTVNLWIAPPDFLTFVERLDAYRALDGAFRELAELSQTYGYPVGALGGGKLPEIRVYFQHYATHEDGVGAWRRRFARVQHDQVALLFTDREGATIEDLKRFDALPFPKLCFVHRAQPEIASAVHIPGYEHDGQVGDLFSEWGRLAKALTTERLQKLLR